MSQYVEISDSNYSGQTALVTFNALEGGVYDLGEQVVPFTFYGDSISPGFSVYGEYVLYYVRFYKTCSISVLPTTTTTTIPITTTTTIPVTTTTTLEPIVCDIDYELNFVPQNTEVELTSVVSPGSVIVEYNLTSNNELEYDLEVSFTQRLGVLIGDDIIINSSVTIYKGNLTGTTLINLDYDYNNLNDTSEFTNLLFNPLDINIGFIFSSDTVFTPQVTLTPTPSVTETSTPTPTPSVTETSTPTPTPSVTETSTPTPTPSVTETSTPTPTPSVTETSTPTPTPSVTETSTPTPTPSVTETSTPTPTPTPSVTETSTPTPTPTPSVTETSTPTPTPTPSVTETSTPTPTPSASEIPISDNFTWSFDDQTGSELNTYVILLNGSTVVNTNRSGAGSFKVSDKNGIRIILTINDGVSATSQLDEDGSLIYDETSGRIPETLDSGVISIVGGSIYVATGIITTK
jgi:hypothetical protein